MFGKGGEERWFACLSWAFFLYFNLYFVLSHHCSLILNPFSPSLYDILLTLLPSLPFPSHRDVASVFHIGETVFSSESYPQLYRTWSPYEVTDNLSTDGELCLVAEEVRKLPPKRGRRPKEYKEHAKKVRLYILLPHPPYLLLHPYSLLFFRWWDLSLGR